MHNPEHLRPKKPDQCVILATDDDVMVLNVVRIALEREGYFLLTAENGEEALYLSRKYPGEIHLLLCDVQMPKMNGIELSKIVSKERPKIGVLLMSGLSELPERRFQFLPKPFNPTSLLATIKGLLPNCTTADDF